MRELTPSEKKIVKLLVDLKHTESYQAFDNLQGSKIYKLALPDILYTKWIVHKKESSLVLGYQKDKDKMFKLTDFLLFLEELENNNMIRAITIGTYKSDEWHEIYDRRKYIKCSELPISHPFYRQKQDNEVHLVYHSKGEKVDVWIDAITEKSNLGIVHYLDKYIYSKIIYPTALLEDYVKNNYKTIEIRQFNEQMSISRLAIIFASILSCISIIVALLDMMSSCCIDWILYFKYILFLIFIILF